jgi:hypothetical protein
MYYLDLFAYLTRPNSRKHLPIINPAMPSMPAEPKRSSGIAKKQEIRATRGLGSSRRNVHQNGHEGL